jgi:hypothetical protein
MTPIKTKTRRPVGTKEFRKLFEKNAHPDDWGVAVVYDYAAWRIWKAATRCERKRLQLGKSGG